MHKLMFLSQHKYPTISLNPENKFLTVSFFKIIIYDKDEDEDKHLYKQYYTIYKCLYLKNLLSPHLFLKIKNLKCRN